MFNDRCFAIGSRVGIAVSGIIAASAAFDNAHAFGASYQSILNSVALAERSHQSNVLPIEGNNFKSVRYKSCIVLTDHGEVPCASPELAASGRPIPLAIGRPVPSETQHPLGGGNSGVSTCPDDDATGDDNGNSDSEDIDTNSNVSTSIPITTNKDVYSSSIQGKTRVLNPFAYSSQAIVDGYEPDDDDE